MKSFSNEKKQMKFQIIIWMILLLVTNNKDIITGFLVSPFLKKKKFIFINKQIIFPLI